MKRILRTILSSTAPLFLALGLFAALPVTAYASPADEVTKGLTATGTQSNNCGPEDNKRACTLADSIQTIVSVLLFIIGTVSVIMIIVGGIRYTTSNGDSSQITAAKNTILYSVIGLVVALLAYAIINFIVDQFAR